MLGKGIKQPEVESKCRFLDVSGCSGGGLRGAGEEPSVLGDPQGRPHSPQVTVEVFSGDAVISVIFLSL